MNLKTTLTVFSTLVVGILVMVLLAGCASHRRYSYNPTTGEIAVEIRGSDSQVGVIDFELNPTTGAARIHVENMSQTDRLIEANQVWAETTRNVMEKLSIP